MRRYAVIVAGGSGVRMGTDIPKQFIPIKSRPILMHTISKFLMLANAPKIIVVLPKDQIEIWIKLCEEHAFEMDHTIATGGETRFHSVRNGLDEIKDINSLVAIHDGVRPLVAVSVIENCYRVAKEQGNAIPVIKPVESVRMEEEEGSFPVDRNKILMVQTPQVFKSSIIKKCYETDFQPSFTDDASVAEFLGIKINLVEGNRENIKITTPLDLKIAESII